MTYKPIPEHRRRELATLIPGLTRKFKFWIGATVPGESENDFWQRLAPSVAPDELVWLLRHVNAAVGRIDPVQITSYTWPGRCKLTGPKATRERWPLEPIPGEPKAQPTPEGPLVDGTPVKEGDVLYYVGADSRRLGRALVAGPLPMGETKPEDSVWFPELMGWLFIADLSRTKPVITKPVITKPVIIEGRVVKPGDVLYYKPTTPEGPIRGQERTVSAIISARTLEFTNGNRGAPESLTYVAPKVEPTRAVGKSPALAAPFGIETFRFINPAVPTHSKEKHTMNQATPLNQAMLAVDASKIVEVKTFVYGKDIATLNDDDLLSHVGHLTNAIEHLENLNERTPLAKLVTKIAQLKDAKAKIVDLLGGAPVQADSDGGTKGNPSVEAQPRKRRTKAELEAAAQGGATPQAQSKPVPPAPPAPTQPEPSVADVDLDD